MIHTAADTENTIKLYPGVLLSAVIETRIVSITSTAPTSQLSSDSAITVPRFRRVNLECRTLEVVG